MQGVQCGEEAHRNLVSAYLLSRLRLPLAACMSLILPTNLTGSASFYAPRLPDNSHMRHLHICLL